MNKFYIILDIISISIMAGPGDSGTPSIITSLTSQADRTQKRLQGLNATKQKDISSNSILVWEKFYPPPSYKYASPTPKAQDNVLASGCIISNGKYTGIQLIHLYRHTPVSAASPESVADPH